MFFADHAIPFERAENSGVYAKNQPNELIYNYKRCSCRRVDTPPFRLNGGRMNEEEKRLAKVIGAAIAKRRKLAGLTQEDVAENLDIGGEAVSRIERGIVIPTVARLVRFAEVFNCPIEELLVESSDRSDDQGRVIASLIARLSSEERASVVEIVRSISVMLEKAKK